MSQSPIETAPWRELRPHLGRDAIIVIRPELDLSAAARAVAGDDAAAVRLWLDEGAVGKPSAAQLEEWEAAPGRPFRFVIVQPYVLIQEVQASAGERELS
jgi:hypothetical protein